MKRAQKRTITRLSCILKNLGYVPMVATEQGTKYLSLEVEVENGPWYGVRITPTLVKGVSFLGVEVTLSLQTASTQAVSEIHDFFQDRFWVLEQSKPGEDYIYLLKRTFEVAESWFAENWLARVHMLMADIIGHVYAAVQVVELIDPDSDDEDSCMLPGEVGAEPQPAIH